MKINGSKFYFLNHLNLYTLDQAHWLLLSSCIILDLVHRYPGTLGWRNRSPWPLPDQSLPPCLCQCKPFHSFASVITIVTLTILWSPLSLHCNHAVIPVITSSIITAATQLPFIHKINTSNSNRHLLIALSSISLVLHTKFILAAPTYRRPEKRRAPISVDHKLRKHALDF